jgi:hypothetical protein
MPAVGLGEIVCGFEVFGDERGILIGMLDGVGKAAVQLCSGGLELRRVGDGLDQWMMKRILRVRGVAGLIDQLRRDQLIDRPRSPRRH